MGRHDDFDTFYGSSKDACFRALMVSVRDAAEAEELLAEALPGR